MPICGAIILKEILQFQFVFCLSPESRWREILNFQAENLSFFELVFNFHLGHIIIHQVDLYHLYSMKSIVKCVCAGEFHVCFRRGYIPFYCDVNFIWNHRIVSLIRLLGYFIIFLFFVLFCFSGWAVFA